MPRAHNLFRVRGLLLLLLAFVVIAASVLGASSVQRSADQGAFDRVQHSQQLLSVWLDRTNALREYLLSGRGPALHASEQSMKPYQAALQTEQTDARDVPGAQAIVANEMQIARRWQHWATVSVAYIRHQGLRPLPLAISRPRTSAAAGFQLADERLTAVMENRREHDVAKAAKVGDGIVVLTFLILALGALAVARARRNRDARAMDARFRDEQDRASDERAYVEGRRRLSQVLLAAETPEEACRLAKSAIESQVSGSAVVALESDTDADGLALLTPAPLRSATRTGHRQCSASCVAAADTHAASPCSPADRSRDRCWSPIRRRSAPRSAARWTIPSHISHRCWPT